MAAQPAGNTPAWGRAGAQRALEAAFTRSLVAPLLQQDVELGTVLIDGPPQQRGLAMQRHEHLIKMPSAAGLAPRDLDPVEKLAPSLLHQ